MNLSNKKIKYIKRNANDKTPNDIAKALRIPVAEVNKVLGISKQKPFNKIISILDNFCIYGLIFISFLAPFIFIDGIYDFANLPQISFIQITVAFIFSAWLIKGILKGQCSTIKSPFLMPILLFVLWSLISLFYAHNKYEGFLLWMHWAVSSLMFFLVLNSILSDKDSSLLLASLFISGFFIGLIGIAQHLFGFSLIPQVVAPAATFANKNMAAHYIVLTFPLAFGIFINSEKKYLPWILSLMTAFMLVFLIYTKTRAGWVAAAAEFFCIAVFLIRERFFVRQRFLWDKNKTLALSVSIIILILMVNLGPEGFKWRFREIVKKTATIVENEETTGDKNSSFSSKQLRLDIWLNTIEMIKDRPFIGFGLGNHKVYYPLYFRKAVTEKQFSETAQLTNVHNDFLQTFAELGIIGMFFLAWLCFVLIKVVFRLTSSVYSRNVRLNTIAIAVAIVGLAVNACFSFPFQRAIPPFVLMILLGVLGYFYADNNPTFLSISKRWLISIAAILISAFLIWLGAFHYNGIKSDRYYKKIIGTENSKIWPLVIEECRWAYFYNPHRVKILSYMGRAYIEMGKYRDAINVLKKVIDKYPYHMNALLNIGVAYGSIGSYTKALEAYHKVLKIKPDYPKVHNNLANIYMFQKKYGKAYKEFKTAAKLDPNNSVIHFNVALAGIQLKHYKKAAEELEKTIHLKQDWDEAHKKLGLLYFQLLNKKKEGIAHLKKALQLNPHIQDANQIRSIVNNQ